jgi:16S rRNA (adenine1518-N6/adenine1519-N6)-dimethyltransferase
MSKIGTISKTQETIRQNKFHIKKKFGQNFLTDQNILRKIVDIPSITKNTLVVEIGPGLGSMTELLLDKAKHVLAYEIDEELIPILTRNFDKNNLTLLNQDILKSNIDEDIKNTNIDYDNVVLVANLPYYITTPIIMKVLEESNLIKQLTVMMQLEVAKRFTSKPSTKDYNSLSVVIQYKTQASIALKVPKTVFIPAPNVDSAIVKMDVKESIEYKPNDEQVFFRIVRAAFTQRRKTLSNNLSEVLSISKSDIQEILISLGHSMSVRAENLSVEELIELSNNIKREMF